MVGCYVKQLCKIVLHHILLLFYLNVWLPGAIWSHMVSNSYVQEYNWMRHQRDIHYIFFMSLSCPLCIFVFLLCFFMYFFYQCLLFPRLPQISNTFFACLLVSSCFILKLLTVFFLFPLFVFFPIVNQLNWASPLVVSPVCCLPNSCLRICSSFLCYLMCLESNLPSLISIYTVFHRNNRETVHNWIWNWISASCPVTFEAV